MGFFFFFQYVYITNVIFIIIIYSTVTIYNSFYNNLCKKSSLDYC